MLRGHKGAIRVESTAGEGTTFTVLFPSTGKAPFEPDEGRRDDVAVTSQARTILVVDDEVTVTNVAARAVRKAGYRVLTAGNGEDAVEVYRRHAGEIDVVLLDYTMPGMSGEETFEAIRRIDPDARILMSSGYSELEVKKHFEGRRLSGFVHKPYSAEALIRQLNLAMNA